MGGGGGEEGQFPFCRLTRKGVVGEWSTTRYPSERRGKGPECRDPTDQDPKTLTPGSREDRTHWKPIYLVGETGPDGIVVHSDIPDG